MCRHTKRHSLHLFAHTFSYKLLVEQCMTMNRWLANDERFCFRPIRLKAVDTIDQCRLAEDDCRMVLMIDKYLRHIVCRNVPYNTVWKPFATSGLLLKGERGNFPGSKILLLLSNCVRMAREGRGEFPPFKFIF